MEKIVNFQTSLFGSFINIKPRTAVVLSLLNNLKDESFIPGTIDLLSLNPISGEIATENRIQMVSEDKTWNIVFLENRIDFNYNYRPDTQKYIKIDDLCNYVKNLVEKVFRTFPETTGNRIAVNGKILLEEMSDDEFKVFTEKFAAPLNLYKGEVLQEWSTRFNLRKEIKWDDKKELCNCITELSKVYPQNDPQINEIAVSIDINTVAQNDDYRFKAKDIIQFSQKANIIIDNVFEEIER